MLRRLGLGKLVGWVLLAMILVAVWQGFHGDVHAMVTKAWELIQSGANEVTKLWNSLNQKKGK